MKSRVVLLIGHECASCEEAEQLWRNVADEMGVCIDIRNIDLNRSREQVTALPTLLVDGNPIVVGVPRAEVASALLRDALRSE